MLRPHHAVVASWAAGRIRRYAACFTLSGEARRLNADQARIQFEELPAVAPLVADTPEGCAASDPPAPAETVCVPAFTD